ncbi:MAG TPA: hypothetical protein VFJ52_10735 [Terriglobia bacterium]|nr:hypothetical protein [Terriglobia bacterium]
MKPEPTRSHRGTASAEEKVIFSKTSTGPPGRFLVGNALELSRNWMEFLTGCPRKYGGAVFFRFFNVPICLLVHPDYIKHALVWNENASPQK